MNARFLITGGAGFIGSHLADALLATGHEVVVLDDLSTGRKDNLPVRVEFVRGTVLDEPLVRNLASGCKGIFHLAAIASVPRCNEQWVESHRINLTGSLTVLSASRSLGGIPVVYASSAAVYGEQGVDLIPEQAWLRPRSPYGADKLGSELHANLAATLFGVPTVGLRFFNVYGPRQDPTSPYSGVISIFLARAQAGLPITLHGDGQQTRDFVFVQDVVAHLISGMAFSQRDDKPTGVFNVCTGVGCSVAEAANWIVDLTGSTSATVHGPQRAGDIRTSVGNPRLARSTLGVIADVPLRDGLRHLIHQK